MDTKEQFELFVNKVDELRHTRLVLNEFNVDITIRWDKVKGTRFILKDVDLLVLDDLGAEKQSSWTITKLFLIIERRLREMLPTIVTSNLYWMGSQRY